MKVVKIYCLLLILSCFVQTTFAQSTGPSAKGPRNARCEQAKDKDRTGLSWTNFSKEACEHACERFDRTKPENATRPDPCNRHSTGDGGTSTNCAIDCDNTYPDDTGKSESCKTCCQAGCKGNSPR